MTDVEDDTVTTGVFRRPPEWPESHPYALPDDHPAYVAGGLEWASCGQDDEHSTVFDCREDAVAAGVNRWARRQRSARRRARR